MQIHRTTQYHLCIVNQKQHGMQGNNIVLFQKLGLSKLNNFNYSDSVNAFIGNGYTSTAGNTYMNEIRLLEGLLIKEDVGQGYARTFINNIKIYDLKSKELLCDKKYNCTFYNQHFIKSEVKSLLVNLLIDASRKDRIQINISDAEMHIEGLVNRAFDTDQRQMLMLQTQKYLNA